MNLVSPDAPQKTPEGCRGSMPSSLSKRAGSGRKLAWFEGNELERILTIHIQNNVPAFLRENKAETQ